MREPLSFSRFGTRASFSFGLAACLTICFLLLSPLCSQAQTLSGLSGTVTDVTGASIEGAKVTAKNDATGVAKSTVTSSSGTYVITDLIPGTYTVQVESPGFQSSVHSGVGVEPSRVSNVNAALQPGETTQSVQVTESLISLNTENPQQKHNP